MPLGADPMRPSATRVASAFSASRQGSRIIWRGMRLTLPPGAIGVAKRLAAAQEEIDEQFHAYDGSYQSSSTRGQISGRSTTRRSCTRTRS